MKKLLVFSMILSLLLITYCKKAEKPVEPERNVYDRSAKQIQKTMENFLVRNGFDVSVYITDTVRSQDELGYWRDEEVPWKFSITMNEFYHDSQDNILRFHYLVGLAVGAVAETTKKITRESTMLEIHYSPYVTGPKVRKYEEAKQYVYTHWQISTSDCEKAMEIEDVQERGTFMLAHLKMIEK